MQDWLLVPVVVGALAVVAGVGLVLSSRRRVSRRRVTPAPAHTSPGDHQRVVERAVFLALELCRVDGAINDTEMAALERAAADRFAGLDPEGAQQVVHRELRATMKAGGDREALAEIVRLADAPHREAVVGLLREVAAADGEIGPDERAFLERVEGALGR